jgi:hypothetical protein
LDAINNEKAKSDGASLSSSGFNVSLMFTFQLWRSSNKTEVIE